MKQTFLPLVISEHVLTFINVLKEIGEDHYQIIRKTLLPENIEMFESGFLTRKVVTDFFTTLDTALPSPVKYQLLRQTALRNAHSIVQSFNMKAAETLFDAITIFVNNVHGISTESTFELQPYMHKLWFVCQRRYVNEPWFRFSETYVVCLLIEIIRLWVGKQWTTSMIRIQSREIYLAALPQPHQALPVFSGQKVTGIHIAQELLSKQKTNWEQVTEKTPPKRDITNHTTFEVSLKKALTPYLCEGRISLSKAAEITNLTKRTLQRRLNEFDMTFSQILDSAIDEEAKRLLRQPECTITQISYMLGYNTPAHFSRAFKRMTQLTPKAYRRQCKN